MNENNSLILTVTSSTLIPSVAGTSVEVDIVVTGAMDTRVAVTFVYLTCKP